MTIAVMRTGSPIYFGGGAGARGDLDTMPVIDYLNERYDIVVFGALRDTDLYEKPLKTVCVDTSRFDENTPNKETESILNEYVEQLREHDVKFVIELWGPPPSWSCPWNPNFARPMAFGVRYSLPSLYAIHKLGIERYGIVTDPKVYKRDLEMGKWWPEVRPRAVLSQEQRTFDREIHGTKFKCHAVYSKCEFWCTHGMSRLQPVKKTMPCFIAANTHLNKTGLQKHDRLAIWRDVLRHCPNGTGLCGTGWEYAFENDQEAERFAYYGEVPTIDDVLDLLNQSVGGPMIPQYPGFNSTKPRLYALANCAPWFYGNGSQEYTYDKSERLVGLWNEGVRWPTCTNFNHSESFIKDYIEEILDATRPDFALLDQLVEAGYQGGYSKCNVKDAWVKKFGGYYETA